MDSLRPSRNKAHMRRTTCVLLLIIIGLLSACNLSDNKTNENSTSRLFSEPDIIDKLKHKKNTIDTLFKYSKNKLIVYAKLVGSDEPILIKNGNFPDNVEISYNILKDSLGHIVTVSEFPLSESGDWDITFTHYFDKDGKTFAFDRQTNFFNSICTSGVAYETRIEFYDSDFKTLNKVYKLIDEKGMTLQKNSCQFPYDYKYKISVGIDTYLQTNKIKTTVNTDALYISKNAHPSHYH